MAVLTRNNIVTNGLVLYLDSRNPQSIPLDPTVNLLLWSQNFSQSVWNKGGSTVTSTTELAPDGTLTACLIDDTTGSLTPGVTTQTISSFPTPYLTFSIYTKKGTASTRNFLVRNATTSTDISALNFNYSTVGSFSGGWLSEDVGNGWFKLSVTVTSSITPGNNITFYWGRTSAAASGSTATWLVWGAQVESSYYPTPYVISTATRGTRNTWTNIAGTGNNFFLITGSALITSSYSSSIPKYSYLNERVLNFDGTGSLAYLPTTTFTSAPITVFLTFKRPTTTGNFLFMWDHDNGGGGGRAQRVGDTFVQLYGTNNIINTITSVALSNAMSVTNQWINLAYTVTGSTVNVYVNGAPIVTDFTMSAPLNSVSGYPIYVGRSDSGTTSYFTTGSFQSVMIYNRVLPQNEVLQNYNAIKTRFGLG